LYRANRLIALRCGVLDGIVVSNHGGRNLDFSRPTVHVLAECTRLLKQAGWVQPQPDQPSGGGGASEGGGAGPRPFTVLLDGGVRRGHDIFKALALGASAVGIGRPALYSLAAGWASGVAQLVGILQEELVTTMMNTGCAGVGDICEAMVERAGAPRL